MAAPVPVKAAPLAALTAALAMAVQISAVPTMARQVLRTQAQPTRLALAAATRHGFRGAACGRLRQPAETIERF
jgi:hypothetical protein